jgi:hypothetical protein
MRKMVDGLSGRMIRKIEKITKEFSKGFKHW